MEFSFGDSVSLVQMPVSATGQVVGMTILWMVAKSISHHRSETPGV